MQAGGNREKEKNTSGFKIRKPEAVLDAKQWRILLGLTLCSYNPVIQAKDMIFNLNLYKPITVINANYA